MKNASLRVSFIVCQKSQFRYANIWLAKRKRLILTRKDKNLNHVQKIKKSGESDRRSPERIEQRKCDVMVGRFHSFAEKINKQKS